jgi:YHS domain-containing protein
VKRFFWLTLLAAIFVPFVVVGADDDSQDAVMDALKSIQAIVGEWEGSGNSDKSKGWDEAINCSWKFAEKGRVSLYFTFTDKKDAKTAGRLIDEAMITYDPAKKQYKFLAYKAGEEDVVEFVGEAKSETNLLLDRVKPAGDNLDRLDIKLLNDGDRLVYTFQRRIGRSSVYRPFAMVGLNRKGVSLAASADSGPKCIVTGGAGTMTVSYKGQTYYVCCSGCRATFLDDPEKFIAKAGK